MSTEKFSDKNLQMKTFMERIEILEIRSEMVKNKIKTNRNKKSDIKLAALEDSKSEKQNRLEIENQKLSNVEEKNRDNEKYGDINPFEFKDIEQHDDEV